MTDDDLTTKASEALLPYLTTEPHHVPDWPEDERAYYRDGDWSSFSERQERLAAMRAAKAASAVIAAVRDQIAAEALLEAADEIHREARWQTEQQMRNAGTPSASQNYYVTCRLAAVESVLRARAYRLDPREAP